MSCIEAIATFTDKIKGTVIFHQCTDKGFTNVFIDLKGFEPNKVHGFHIHEYGDLRQGCKSLGGHYNPYNKNHGSRLIHGKDRHMGDECNNIYSDLNGNVKFNFVDDLIKVPMIIGRSQMIHYGPQKGDDLGLGIGDNKKESLKTGNAGGRISCAIIGFANQNIK